MDRKSHHPIPGILAGAIVGIALNLFIRSACIALIVAVLVGLKVGSVSTWKPAALFGAAIGFIVGASVESMAETHAMAEMAVPIPVACILVGTGGSISGAIIGAIAGARLQGQTGWIW